MSDVTESDMSPGSLQQGRRSLPASPLASHKFSLPYPRKVPPLCFGENKAWSPMVIAGGGLEDAARPVPGVG